MAIALGLTIPLWPVSWVDKRNLLLAWLVKCTLTLFFMLFFESHYGSDADMYFGAARRAAGYSEVGLHSGTLRMIALARMHYQMVGDSYHAMKVTWSLIGLIGIYLIYRASVIFRGREDSKLFFFFALFPGVLFWSSILGKDPLVFFGIDLYAYGVVGWYCRRSWGYLLCIAGGILVAVYIRQWLGPLMLVPLGVFVFFGVKGVVQRCLLIAFVAILMYFSAQALMDRFKISAVEDVVSSVETASENMSRTGGGSTRHVELDFSSVGSIVRFLPMTSFTALFRPLPGEVLNPFGLLAGLESAYLLLLVWRALRRTTLAEVREPLVLWAVLFVVMWAMLNGIVSSMNFGLTVRYKLQILPIMLGVLLYLSRDREGGAPGRRRRKCRKLLHDHAAEPVPGGQAL